MASSSSYQSGTNGANYVCPNCNGGGTIDDNGKIKQCPTCYGIGTVSYKTQQAFLNSQPLGTIPTKVIFVTCPECSGSKQINDPTNGKLSDCPLCEASGVVEEEVKKKWLKDNGAI